MGCEWSQSRDGVLDGGGYRRRERDRFAVNVGHPIVTNRILCVRGGDAALPKLLLGFVVTVITV